MKSGVSRTTITTQSIDSHLIIFLSAFNFDTWRIIINECVRGRSTGIFPRSTGGKHSRIIRRWFFYEKKCLVWPLVFISSGPIDLFSALIVFETWKKWAYFPLKKIIFENKNQSKRPKELYVIVNKISYPIYLKR